MNFSWHYFHCNDYGWSIISSDTRIAHHCFLSFGGILFHAAQNFKSAMILFNISIKRGFYSVKIEVFSKLLSFSHLPLYSTWSRGCLFLAFELQRYLLWTRSCSWIHTVTWILMWSAGIPWHSWPNPAELGYAALSRLLDNLMQLPCSPSRFLASSSWQKMHKNENNSMILLNMRSQNENRNQTSKDLTLSYELFHATYWNSLLGRLGDAQALKMDIVINLTNGSKTTLLALEMSVFDCMTTGYRKLPWQQKPLKQSWKGS